MAIHPLSHSRILLVRSDRLGDVLLCTPALSVLRQVFPRAHLGFAVQPWIAPVLRGLPELDEVIALEGRDRELFSKGRWDCVIFFQWDERLARAAWRAQVPTRVGPRAKPLSYLWLNKGLRQARSKVQKHEVRYNLDLLSTLGIESELLAQSPPTRALVPPEGKKAWERWQSTDAFFQQPFGVVHPGMGGSALNWPVEHYIRFIELKLAAGAKLVVTQGPSPADQELGEGIRKALSQKDGSLPAGLRILGPTQLPDLGALAALLSQASWVLAPSTGPLHLANALGVPVFGIFPPIRVQSAKRWGPWMGRSQVWTPEVDCPARFKCLGSRCSFYPCMPKVKPDDLFRQTEAWMAESSSPK